MEIRVQPVRKQRMSTYRLKYFFKKYDINAYVQKRNQQARIDVMTEDNVYRLSFTYLPKVKIHNVNACTTTEADTPNEAIEYLLYQLS
jgi:hypothetical protein